MSAPLPMRVALDGDGATTFLISITALLPIHRHIRMNPLVLPGIVALAAGTMNILPWNQPTRVLRYEPLRPAPFNLVFDVVLEGGVNASLGLDGQVKSLSFQLLSAQLPPTE